MFGITDDLIAWRQEAEKLRKEKKQLMGIIDTLLNNNLGPNEKGAIRQVFEMLKAAEGNSENPS